MFDTCRSCAIAAAATLALLAAGCGGGGGQKAATHPIDPIIGSADTLLMSGMVVSTPGGDIRFDSSCRGTSCAFRASGAAGVEVGELTVSGLTDDSEDEWPAATETHRGVSLARKTAVGAVGELITGGSAWAGWLEHNVFLVGHATLGDNELGGSTFPFAASFGNATGTNPVAGSATWSGVMLGTDMSAAGARPRDIRGDADIMIADFASPSVEVAFTNVRDVATGGARDDMNWPGMPLTDGRFGSGSAGDAIEGAFYGPGHQEVGGVFERDRVFGAFGAKRQ